MAAVVAQSLLWTGPALGGVGSLPERTRCSCSLAPSVSGTSLFTRASRQGRSSVSSKTRRSTIVSHQDERGSADSRVFKSMSEAAGRRKGDAALAAFDDGDIARAISDAELSANVGYSTRSGKAVQPPRFATLRAFGEASGEGVVTREFEGTSVFELIAANIEASKQVKNWEVLSGRLAMLALSVALGVELVTGNSVFNGVDNVKLEAVAALCVVASLSAAGFAYAWRAKTDVVNLMSKGYKNMVESALDNLIDGLFFDES